MVAGTFVGRAEQLREIDRLLDSVLGGSSQTLLITGEAGIGKTALSEQVEVRAKDRGFEVSWGRCWEHGGSPPLFPWIQVLRHLSSTTDGASLIAEGKQFGEVIASLIGTTEDDGADVGDRFVVLDSVVRFLDSFGASSPLLLILEDLHLADESTLVLLLFATRNLRTSRVAIVGTFRTGEATESPRVAEIAKEAQRMSLGPLTADDVVKLFTNLGGLNAKGRAAELHEATGGNPLLTTELARSDETTAAAGETGRGVADNVRSMVELRLRAVTDETRALLTTASVLGRDIETPVVRSLTMLDDDALSKAMQSAVSSGIISRSKDGWAFVHDLVRQALYDDLEPSNRALLHQRAADALEQLYPHQVEQRASEIAYHLMRSGAADPRARGAAASARAGRLALRRHAYEEAERHLSNALELYDRDAPEQVTVLTQLIQAQLGQGRRSTALETTIRAAESAERLDRPVDMARALATLGFHRYVSVADADGRVLDLIDRSLALLPSSEIALTAMLTAFRLFEDYVHGPDIEPYLEEVLPKLREGGDPVPLLFILRTLLVTTLSLQPERALSYAREALEVSRRNGFIETEARAIHRLCTIYLELGEITKFDAEVDRFSKANAARQLPFLRWSVLCLKTTQALIRGDFDRARAYADEAVPLAEETENPNGLVAWGVSYVSILEHRGPLDELLEWSKASVEQFPLLLTPRAGISVILAETGRTEEALAWLTPVLNGLEGSRPDLTWLATAALCGRALAIIGEESDAARLYQTLLPFEKRHWFVDVGLPVSYHGSIAMVLGNLANRLGDRSAAVSHHKIGLKLHEALGAAPYAAWSRFHLGHLHLESDPERAATLLAQARAAAEDLGMAVLTQRLDDVEAPTTSPHAPAGKQHLEMALEGDYWTVALEGRTLRLKDIRGLHYLATLFESPGTEMHALDLAMAGSRTERKTHAEPDLQVAGGSVKEALLDPQAKAAYKSRIEDLRSDIEDAERDGDLGRKERAQEELDFIAEQLSAALGMAGRDRTWSDPTEKARVSVTKSLKRALSRIAKEDQSLGRFLEASISTGTFCSFNDSVFPWEVRVTR